MNKQQRSTRGSERASGFTMIEMLVTVVILSVGLLGLAALQARGQQFNHMAYSRSQATLLAYELGDKMRINWACARGPILKAGGATPLTGCDNGYAGATGVAVIVNNTAASTACDINPCTPAQLMAYDITNWGYNIKRLLGPTAFGSITWNDVDAAVNPNTYAVSVSWQQPGDTNDTGEPALISQTWIVGAGQ